MYSSGQNLLDVGETQLAVLNVNQVECHGVEGRAQP